MTWLILRWAGVFSTLALVTGLLAVILGHNLKNPVLALGSLSQGQRGIALFDTYTRVTAHLPLPGTILDFDWSPDGTELVFSSDTGEGARLIISEFTGRDPQHIEGIPHNASAPTWSTDGQWIAYELADSSGSTDIWLTSMDGSTITNLTNSRDKRELRPVWTQDSRRIVYQVRRASNYDIALQAIDTTDVEILISGEGNDVFPALSPDENLIAFKSDRFGVQETFIQSPAGLQRPLPDTPQTGSWLSWSPDMRLAFATDTTLSTTSALYIYDSETQDIQAVETGGAAIMAPVWTTDGSAIYFLAVDNRQPITLRVLDVASGHISTLFTARWLAPDLQWQP